MAKRTKKFQADLPPRDFTTFIGIDPSLTATGVVVLDAQGNHVNSDTIATKASEPLSLRIGRIVTGVRRIDGMVVNTIGDIPMYVIETPYAGISGQTGQTGMILAALAYTLRREISFKLNVTPSQVKAMLGSGSLKKNQIMQQVLKKWQFEADNDNLADAFVLAKIGQMYCQGCNLEYEKATMAKIEEHHRKSIWSQ